MLDIKFIKENTQLVKTAMKNRNMKLDEVIDKLCVLDDERKALIFASEQNKAKQNAVSKQIPQLKKEGKDVAPIFAEMKELSDMVKRDDARQSEIEAQMQELLYEIPNIPADAVPVGKDDGDNVEMRRFGEPKNFGFEPKAHWDIGKDLGILDPETAGKVSGARFHFYRGLGAKLERAIISFFLDSHSSRGYEEILPPYLVNRASMTGTGQLPKFEEDAFKTTTDLFLIPTAEVPVTNMYRGDILDGTTLPLSYCAYSACFRAEAGSAGRDTRGLIRQHQFNKVELVKFTRPEQSWDELESLTASAEQVLKDLGLPYRVVRLCSGDLGFSSAMTYDIEVWMPSYGRYVEISSCSNFLDFQARRAGIKFKDDVKSKAQFVHTLNGSGVAVGRTTAAILENFQNEDGSVDIPEALRPYMGGIAKIPAK
ncbi:MAG: serine--tRNA ligase [Clostridia bacterium]|nr:serine--tRNA ligase [Clostridia bacterium]